MLLILYKLRYTFAILLVATMIFVFGDIIPTDIKILSYTLSLLIKDVLVSAIPFLIIIYIANSIISISNRAFIFIIIILGSVLLSSILAVSFSYFFAHLFVLNSGILIIEKSASIQELTTFFDTFSIKLIPTELAIAIGFALGLLVRYFNHESSIQKLSKAKSKIDHFLKNFFIPILPIFIAGFIFKIEFEGTFDLILNSYSTIFKYFILSQLSYLFIIILLFSGFSPAKVFLSIKNIIPAAFTGFSTMSSAATMPVSIIAAEKNTQNPTISRIIIPTTANIHLAGTSVGMNILIIGTMLTNGFDFPEFNQYLIFAVFFSLAQFGAIAVPGGFVFTTLPILQTYLGFTPEMAALIASLSIIFDPVDTSMNVSINVMFVSYFAKINKLLNRKSNITLASQKIPSGGQDCLRSNL